jgi:hypothetical protein
MICHPAQKHHEAGRDVFQPDDLDNNLLTKTASGNKFLPDVSFYETR